MSESVFEDVELFCSLVRSRPVVFSLRVTGSPKVSIQGLVRGVAVSCDCEVGCLKGVQCLLGKRITGRKRR